MNAEGRRSVVGMAAFIGMRDDMAEARLHRPRQEPSRRHQMKRRFLIAYAEVAEWRDFALQKRQRRVSFYASRAMPGSTIGWIMPAREIAVARGSVSHAYHT